MGVDIISLITEWSPAVAAYREAGGLDFYWNANMARNERGGDALPELPFLEEEDLPGGKAFLEAGYYYDLLRPHLPAHLRDPADTAFGLVLPGDEEWMSTTDDLMTDAGTGEASNIIYAFRPATAAAVAAMDIPWDELRAVAADHPVPAEYLAPPGTRNGMYTVIDWEMFEWHAGAHLAIVASAARASRGIVTILSI